MAGRKRIELTEEIQARIISAVEVGAAFEHAALHGGISYKTFSRWMELGEKSKSRKTQIYKDFFKSVNLARSNFIFQSLGQIELFAHDRKNWQALAWRLERLLPEVYGKRHEAKLGNNKQDAQKDNKNNKVIEGDEGNEESNSKK